MNMVQSNQLKGNIKNKSKRDDKMKILKYNTDSKIKPLRIKNKCKCGTKVLIDDINDIIYSGDHEYILSGFLDQKKILIFGYMCPRCDSFVKLSILKSNIICKYLEKTGFDMEEYDDKCWDSVNRFSGSKEDMDLFDECIERGYPVPLNLYKKFMR